MLDSDGTICFVDEVMRLVDGFLRRYQEQEGPFRNGLEKGLVISYALGCIKQDTERVWNALGQAPLFRGVSPREVYEEGVATDSAGTSELVSRIRERRWLELGLSGHGIPSPLAALGQDSEDYEPTSEE